VKSRNTPQNVTKHVVAPRPGRAQTCAGWQETLRSRNYTQFDGQCWGGGGGGRNTTQHNAHAQNLVPPPQTGAVDRSKVTSVTSHTEVIHRSQMPQCLSEHNDRNLFNDGLIMARGRERKHGEDFLSAAPTSSLKASQLIPFLICF
jgi:hypothetical protein